MRDLTEKKALGLISKNVADFTHPIFLYIPSTKFEQPFIMYQSRNYGHTKEHLSNDIKLSFDAGMHKYNPKQEPFDITKCQLSDWNIDSAEFEYGEFTIIFFEVNAIHLNKSDAIAIAKAIGATSEDFK